MSCTVRPARVPVSCAQDTETSAGAQRTRRPPSSHRRVKWLTPASAGNTVTSQVVDGGAGEAHPRGAGACRSTHPRVCGEHQSMNGGDIALVDSPPRVRGARDDNSTAAVFTTLTPACAGSTLGRNSCQPRRSTHPRVCGEHEALARQGVCGDVPIAGCSVYPSLAGSSRATRPVTKPQRRHFHPSLKSRGLAGAQPDWCGQEIGSPVMASSLLALSGAQPHPHPRVCGEHDPPYPGREW